MERLPTFGTIEFYVVSEVVAEGEHPEWMTEWDYEIVQLEDKEGWLETVKSNMEKIPEFNFELKKMSNKEYEQKHVFGCPYDDISNMTVDADCPECGHLLVEQHKDGCFCSNHDCEYIDDDMKAKQEKWEKIRNSPPDPQFREEGQTLDQFKEKYKFDRETIKDRVCTVCKQETFPNDWYRTKKYAAIVYGGGHKEDCTNKGCPATMIPLGDEAKRWNGLLFGEYDE